MTEGRANPLSPSDIARHAGVSKALIYKHFGSVEALVDDAIRSRLQLLDIDAPAEHEDKAEVLERILRVVSKLREEIQNQPELIGLIGWSLGNPDLRAVKVMEAVRRFCEKLAARADAGAEAATFFLGVFASVLCNQQERVSEEIQEDKS
jgi:AcrR family transcriptional regulator